MSAGVDEHAAVVVEHSLDVATGDDVLIEAPPAAVDLVTALYERVAAVGGTPVTTMKHERARGAFLRTIDEAALTEPTHSTALFEASDAVVNVSAPRNASELEDVPAATSGRYHELLQPTFRAATDSDWVKTEYPTPAAAQRAGMSEAAYERLVWEAITVDWDAQRRKQRRLASLLESGSTLSVTTPSGSRFEGRIEDMTAETDFGKRNLPGGEVFTAPVVDSIDGVLRTEVPFSYDGQDVKGVTLEVSDGRVVDHEAEVGERALAELLDHDEGSSRFGEVGFGTNPAIDRITSNALFDEKVRGTMHLALGRAYEETVPDDRECNESDVHVDIVFDLREGGEVTVDGTPVLADGSVCFDAE